MGGRGRGSGNNAWHNVCAWQDKVCSALINCEGENENCLQFNDLNTPLVENYENFDLYYYYNMEFDTCGVGVWV